LEEDSVGFRLRLLHLPFYHGGRDGAALAFVCREDGGNGLG